MIGLGSDKKKEKLIEKRNDRQMNRKKYKKTINRELKAPR